MTEDKFAKEYEEYETSKEKEYHREDLRQNPPNFIDKLAWKIYEANPIVDLDVSYACATTLLNSVLPKVRIKTRLGYLPLGEMNLIVGASGTSKTLPFRIVRDVLKDLKVKETEEEYDMDSKNNIKKNKDGSLKKIKVLKNKKLNMDLPERYTSEGIEGYFAAKVQRFNKETKQNEDTNEYQHVPYGTMVIDEISQMFKESSKKEYLAGSIEQLAQFYDMHLKATALSSGVRIPQEPYICLIAGTVPEFIPNLPDFIFAQGLAGRFHWVFIEPKKDAPPLEIMDFRSYTRAKTGVEAYKTTLQKLLELNVSKDFNSNDEIIPIRISSKASIMWRRYHNKKYGEWYINSVNNPYDYDWQFLRRLPEQALRLAGTYAVGRVTTLLTNAKRNEDSAKKKFSIVEVREDDIHKAINRIDVYEKHIKKILRIKTTGVVYTMGTRKAKGEVFSVDNVIICLNKAKNRRLNLKQLHQATKITDNRTLRSYINKAIKAGLVKKRDRQDVLKELEKQVKEGKIFKQEQKQEIERLALNKNVKIFELTDDA